MKQELEAMYQAMGIEPCVYAYGTRVLEGLQERFARIDQVAEYN